MGRGEGERREVGIYGVVVQTRSAPGLCAGSRSRRHRLGCRHGYWFGQQTIRGAGRAGYSLLHCQRSLCREEREERGGDGGREKEGGLSWGGRGEMEEGERGWREEGGKSGGLMEREEGVVSEREGGHCRAVFTS